jgi:hypothetical protein
MAYDEGEQLIQNFRISVGVFEKPKNIFVFSKFLKPAVRVSISLLAVVGRVESSRGNW